MNLPVEVIDAVNDGKCILFVGARFSGEAAEDQSVDYPDVKALAKALGWKRPRQLMGARTKVSRPSPSEGAKLFLAAHGRSALQAKLSELLGVTTVQPTEFHKAAVQRFPLIITTCQDDLLERSAVALGAAAQVCYRGDDLPSPDPACRVIYKLNGGFEKPDGLVLTPADRQPMSDALKKQFRKLIRSRVVLFVGYRPDHEEFEAVFDDLTQCYGGELPRCHLAVAQGRIDDVMWQKWVWRGLLMFTADPSECMTELEARIQQ